MWYTLARRIMHLLRVRCVILDGALEIWFSNGYPLIAIPGHYPPPPCASTRAGDAASPARGTCCGHEGDGACVVVSALPADAYLGKSDVKYGGRRGDSTDLVGAPKTGLVGWQTRCFACAAAIAARFERAGRLAAKRVIIHRGSGGCATTGGLTLALLGRTKVTMYDKGLWGWGNAPALLVNAQNADA